jgi:hypothetical protein
MGSLIAVLFSFLLTLAPHATLKVSPQVCMLPCHIKVTVKVNAEENDRAFLVGMDGEALSTRPIVPYTVEIPYTIREEGDHLISLDVLAQDGRKTFTTFQKVMVAETQH